MKTRHVITTTLAWAGVLAAVAIPFVLAVAKWNAGWSDVRWLPSRGNEVHIGPQSCELYLLFEGDLSDFPIRWQERWGKRLHLGNESVFFEVHGLVGVPVHARQLRVHIDTWWVILALLQPMLWRLAARQRLARAALIGCCAKCGYDLRGSSGDCPECGVVASERHTPPRRPVFAALAAMSFVLVTAMSWQVLTGKDRNIGPFSTGVTETRFHATFRRGDVHWKFSPTETRYLDALGVSLVRWSTAAGEEWRVDIAKPLLLSLTATLPVLWLLRTIRLRREELARASGHRHEVKQLVE